MREEIEQSLRKIIMELLELTKPIEEIENDEDLTKLGMNSISTIELVVEVEAKYDFEFNDEDLLVENFKTIERLATYIEKRIGE